MIQHHQKDKGAMINLNLTIFGDENIKSSDNLQKNVLTKSNENARKFENLKKICGNG